ncbi:MAG: DUF115 domain-containing protein [Simkaniaceae bacterium]|nr:DUF115 domain-containing protein [Simkaniaceae bacterium]
MYHDRFPELSFIAKSVKTEGAQCVLYDAPHFTPKEQVQVYYVYGLGDGTISRYFESWLAKDLSRRLVFIEDDAARIRMLEETGELDRLAKEKQIFIRFIIDSSNLQGFIDQLCIDFATPHCAFVAFGPYKERGEPLRLGLLQTTYLDAGERAENLQQPYLLGQLMRNLIQLERASYINQMQGAFHKIPAVICGAGPSLDREIELLGELGSKALFFAGGSTLAALGPTVLRPHFAMVYDPNPWEFGIIRPASCLQSPVIFNCRSEARFANALNGPSVFAQEQSGGLIESEIFKKLGITEDPVLFDRSGLTVTTAAISMATLFDCDPIILVGVDLSTTLGRDYAGSVDAFERSDLGEEESIGLNNAGEKVKTRLKWEVEANWMSQFAKANPERKFYQTSKEGLAIDGIEYQSLESLAEESLVHSYDLWGGVYQTLRSHEVEMPREMIQGALCGVKESVERCMKYYNEREAGDYDAIVLEDELAFKALLAGVEPPLRKQMCTSLLNEVQG